MRSNQDKALEVWLDSDLAPACLVGTLAHDRGQVRFRYDRNWLGQARAFALDPDLSLDDQPFFPKPELGNFGVFLDSSPDRWGQTLLKRRDALQAKDEKRTPRTLYAWDFLIGVQDFTRQGALRFRLAGTDVFLGNEKMAAPPFTTLRELEAVAFELSSRRIDDLDALRKWLAVLVAPGASLGGARPKANFTEADGTLWIGKFPARDDERDVGADLEQLFRRVAFNAAVGNRDDHLRNHGFVLGTNGWQLAPAFDVNPNIDKAEHVLNIDDADNRPSLQTVLSTAPFYGLTADRATQVGEEVASAVDSWRNAARKTGIAAADVELTAGAFSAHAEYRA